MNKKEGLLEKLKKIRRDQWIVLLLAGILMVVVSLPASKVRTDLSSAKQQAGASGANELIGKEQTAAAAYSGMEERLEKILSAMEGAGDVRVMITVKDGGEKIVEKDSPSSGRTTLEGQGGSSGSTVEEERQEATVFEKSGSGYETPYVTQELAPRVEGVLVLAQGADNAIVKKDITDAVMALFNVEAHKIKVMKMQERRG